MVRNWINPKICHFGVKYSNSVLNCLSFIIIPLNSQIQIKVLINDLTLLLDLFWNSEGTKLLIWTVIFCLVFTAPEKWRVELRAKTGHYRNRCWFQIMQWFLGCIFIFHSMLVGWYFGNIASWKQETTSLRNHSSEIRNRTPDLLLRKPRA